MANHRIYQYTSIGRPVEPGVPSVRAVLILLPLAAILGLVLGIKGGQGMAPSFLNALYFMLAVYGSWALARELDPDDTPAAFISVTAALLAMTLIDNAGHLPCIERPDIVILEGLNVVFLALSQLTLVSVMVTLHLSVLLTCLFVHLFQSCLLPLLTLQHLWDQSHALSCKNH